MTLNPSIILAGRSPDIMGQLGRGTQTAAMQNAVQKDNRLAQLYATQGAGIMGGDQNALAALAGVDPMAALGIQESRLGMDATRQNMEVQREQLTMARQAARQSAAAQAAQMDAAAAAQEAAKIESGIAAALAATSQEQLDAFLQQTAPELVGQVTMENRELYAAQALGVKDALEMARGPQPQSGPGKVQADIAAGLLPEGTPLRDGGDTINVNPGSPFPGLSKLGEGFTYLYNEDGSIRRDEMGRPMSAPIPGSKAAMEVAEGNQKAGEKARQQRIKMGTTLENIALNIEEIENGGVPVTGLIGAAGSWLPGTPQRDVSNRTEQITTRGALEELQNMRDNSPTGGAVGQLTDDERKAIAFAATTLSQSSSQKEYLRNAKKFRETMLDLAYGEGYWELDEITGEVILKEGGSAEPPGTATRLYYNPDTGEYE